MIDSSLEAIGDLFSKATDPPKKIYNQVRGENKATAQYGWMKENLGGLGGPNIKQDMAARQLLPQVGMSKEELAKIRKERGW